MKEDDRLRDLDFVNTIESIPLPTRTVVASVEGKGTGVEWICVLDEDDEEPIYHRSWDKEYEEDEQWGGAWKELTEGRHLDDYFLWNGKIKARGKICVPTSIVPKLVKALHELGHAGRHKMEEMIKRKYWLPPRIGLRRIVMEVLNSCLGCQAAKPRTGLHPDSREFQPIPQHIFASLAMDFVDLPKTKYKGEEYDVGFVIVDRLSGYVLCFPCAKKGLTGESVAHLFFHRAVMFLGVPKEIYSDVDIRLVSSFFQTLCTLLGIEQYYSTVYRPQSNGRAETAVKLVINTLRKLLVEQNRSWVEVLPLALWAINDMPTVNNLPSPHKILFGRDAPTFGDLPPIDDPERSVDCKKWLDTMECHRNWVSRQLLKLHTEATRKFKEKHPPVTSYQPGDLVWIKLRDKERVGKLDPLWSGPYTVNRREHEKSYWIDRPETGPEQYHVDELKIYPLQLQKDGKKRKEIAFVAPRTKYDEHQRKQVEEVLDHRLDPYRNKLQLKIRWRDEGPKGDTWEPASTFFLPSNWTVRQYLKKKGTEYKVDNIT
jgi:transposase InsO family protein